MDAWLVYNKYGLWSTALVQPMGTFRECLDACMNLLGISTVSIVQVDDFSYAVSDEDGSSFMIVDVS